MIDGLLVLGFGGPTPGCCGRRSTCSMLPGCEAECFVSGILGDNVARGARIAEVTAHYQLLGGFSPYNELTRVQALAVQAGLRKRGIAMPVACGYRHWRPWAQDALCELHAAGCREVAVLIMAPHQSSVSWDWYLKYAAEAAEKLGAASPRLVAVVAPWWDQPGFIEASVQRIRDATSGWSASRLAKAHLIFTAHAIPQPVEATAPYRAQFAHTARLVAEALGHPAHAIAFQSQPTDSRIPWSQPTVEAAMDSAHASGASDVLIQAAGFLVDHTEVLFDLDVEARAHASTLGLTLTRVPCVHDHTAFIAMLCDRVEQTLLAQSP
jgi:ferrochelatase